MNPENSCLKGCGESGKTSRILHVDPKSGKTTAVVSSTKDIFMDVAAVHFPKGDKLITLHIEQSEAKEVYTGGPWEIKPNRWARTKIGPFMKFLRPAGCPDKKGCSCPAECTPYKGYGEKGKDAWTREYGCGQGVGTSGAHHWPKPMPGSKDTTPSICVPKVGKKVKLEDCGQGAKPEFRSSPASWSQSLGNWGGSIEAFNQQRGLLGWPTNGDITKPKCMSTKCSCCFHTCPNYVLRIHDLSVDKEAGGFKAIKPDEAGVTKTIKASCVVPSIAADREKVFVLSSTELAIYSMKGQQLHTPWRSPKLEYGGTLPYANGPFMWYFSVPNTHFHRAQMRGRSGGQITLNTNDSGVAKEAYFTTIQGRIFRVTVSNKIAVTELLTSEHHAFMGATLQTYEVPGMPQQKRLYTSAKIAGIPSEDNTFVIDRINLNALEALYKNQGNKAIYMQAQAYYESKKYLTAKSVTGRKDSGSDYEGCVNSTNNMCLFPTVRAATNYDPITATSGIRCPPFSAHETRQAFMCDQAKKTWDKFAKSIFIGSATTDRRSRMAYAKGGLYFLTVGMEERARLERMDVTLFNACEDVWALTNQTFYDWKVDPADYGKAVEAPEKPSVKGQGHPNYANLHETTPAGPAMPWQFRAYRKLFEWKGQMNGKLVERLIAKEMVCSLPKQPSTRPSQEKCCVRKRMLISPVHVKQPLSSCLLDEVMKQM
jgi:hypothetical protein